MKIQHSSINFVFVFFEYVKTIDENYKLNIFNIVTNTAYGEYYFFNISTGYKMRYI